MEKSEEKKQNNRKVDERRHPDSKDNEKPNAKEWDPNRDKKDNRPNDDVKLNALKDVRNPQDDDDE